MGNRLGTRKPSSRADANSRLGQSGPAYHPQLRLGRQMQEWFIPFVDKRVDVRVTL